MPGTYKGNSHYCHRKHQEDQRDDTRRKAEMDVAGNQRGDSKMLKVETTVSTITDNSKPTLIQNTEGKGTKADERSTKKIMGKAYEINKQRRPRCGKKFEEYLEKHIE
jgi:hypothetical protein